MTDSHYVYSALVLSDGPAQRGLSRGAMPWGVTLAALAGHACGLHFKAAEHLKQHPEFNWQKEYLRDMNAHPWATFTAGM